MLSVIGSLMFYGLLSFSGSLGSIGLLPFLGSLGIYGLLYIHGSLFLSGCLRLLGSLLVSGLLLICGYSTPAELRRKVFMFMVQPFMHIQRSGFQPFHLPPHKPQMGQPNLYHLA